MISIQHLHPGRPTIRVVGGHRLSIGLTLRPHLGHRLAIDVVLVVQMTRELVH